jgi:hypothetical protein
MKVKSFLFFAAIFAAAILCGSTIEWWKFKKFPKETTKEVSFKIDSKIVKNPEPHKTYYGTKRIVTIKKATGWPKVETIVVSEDTLSVEEGGYYGVFE